MISRFCSKFFLHEHEYRSQPYVKAISSLHVPNMFDAVTVFKFGGYTKSIIFILYKRAYATS